MKFKKNILTLVSSKEKEFKVSGFSAYSELYDIRVDVFFGNNKKAVEYFELGGVDGFCEGDGGMFLLYVKDKKDIQTMAHETYHLVNLISKHLRFSDDDHNEPQAYLSGLLLKKILELAKL